MPVGCPVGPVNRPAHPRDGIQSRTKINIQGKTIAIHQDIVHGTCDPDLVETERFKIELHVG